MAQTNTIEVDPAEIVSRTADDRGRVRLGPEYGEKDVVVAVIDADAADETSS